mmetsp:Transcript_39146/g.90396  ORF Transcript_39146/g.90396 Transcript_39146/m.90396 type:complete len:135 (-) Transcript_39146:269-673(-)
MRLRCLFDAVLLENLVLPLRGDELEDVGDVAADRVVGVAGRRRGYCCGVEGITNGEPCVGGAREVVVFDASGTLLRHMLSATCRKSWWCPDENTENRQPSSSSRGNMPKQTPQTFSGSKCGSGVVHGQLCVQTC